MTSSRKKHQHDNWLVDVKDGCFHKNVKFTSAAVYEINKNIEHSNKHRFSYSDDMIGSTNT